MSEKTLKKEDLDKLTDSEKLLYRDYKEDIDAHDDAISEFDAFEAMHMGKTYDSESRKTNNGLTDSMTSTIYLERASRVAGKLPEGEVQAFGKKDKGKGLLMDLIRQKYIYPNANAQHPFKTKMYLLQYGSSEYGFMPIYYDLNDTPGGYYGPDCWLWNPRNFIPQNGFMTVEEMDYVHAIAYKSPRFFQDILDEETTTWDKEAIKDVIDQIKHKTRNADNKRDTLENQTRQNQSARQISVVTRYEAGKKGHWITFLPEFGYKIIRDIPNPHKNGKIPFVVKPCIPSFDTFYGMGDFKRSMPMQFANDGLDNFYFQGIKRNLYPSTVVDAQTAIMHTVDPNTPGSIIQMNGNVNGIKTMETSTAGLSTYQAAKGMAKGAIQSIAGTTDTRANAESAMDPGMGKTPEALKMIGEREATRDGQDREFLEEAMKQLIDGMLSLIPTMKQKIPLELFSKEIEDIVKAGHTDIMDVLKISKQSGLISNMKMSDSEEQLRIKLDPTKLNGLEYRFELQPNSTAKKTKEAQLTALMDYLTFLGKMPNLLTTFQETTGKVLNLEEINKQFATLADIPGMDNMFVDAPQPEPPVEAPAEPPVETQSGITPEQLVQAAATPPEQLAVQPEVPAEDPLIVNGMKFTDPELAAQARTLLNMR